LPIAPLFAIKAINYLFISFLFKAFDGEIRATLKVHWMIELTNTNQRRFNLSLAQTIERDDGLHPTDKSVGIRPTIL